jgi:hypothetical protein
MMDILLPTLQRVRFTPSNTSTLGSAEQRPRNFCSLEALRELVGQTLIFLAAFYRMAVSRTATAPFDRLKVFLITQPPQLMGINGGGKGGFQGTRAIALAISSLYAEGGLRAFWVGNGKLLFKPCSVG